MPKAPPRLGRILSLMLAHPAVDVERKPDNIVLLPNTSWADYQRLLEIRGERSVPRLAYLEGVVEIMSPSNSHEWLKSWIGCLVEAWCMEQGVEFSPCGSWTLENKEAQRGVEPDECYVFGVRRDAPRPDLAIEIIWTHSGLDKLDIYRRLGVREVWIWRHERLTAHALRSDQYQEVPASELLPGLDLAELTSYLDRPTASQAIREYQSRLRERR